MSSTDKKDENEKNCLELENLQTINWNNSGRIKFTRKDLKAFGINIGNITLHANNRNPFQKNRLPLV